MTVDWFIVLPIESPIADFESSIANPYERRRMSWGSQQIQIKMNQATYLPIFYHVFYNEKIGTSQLFSI